jgi:hypothetical protein
MQSFCTGGRAYSSWIQTTRVVGFLRSLVGWEANIKIGGLNNWGLSIQILWFCVIFFYIIKWTLFFIYLYVNFLKGNLFNKGYNCGCWINLYQANICWRTSSCIILYYTFTTTNELCCKLAISIYMRLSIYVIFFLLSPYHFLLSFSSSRSSFSIFPFFSLSILPSFSSFSSP